MSVHRYFCDLTPLDYYLWGHVKELVYNDSPQTIGELAKSIAKAIRNIPQQTLERVFENMKKRVELCVKENGHHFEHLLY